MKKEDLKVGMVLEYSCHFDLTVMFVGNIGFMASFNNGNRTLEIYNTFNELIFYTEKKPEPKIEILYECLNNEGDLGYFFENGAYPSFNSKEKLLPNNSILKYKTGKTLKLNMDNWELVKE